MIIVANFYFDMAGSGVMEGIADHFAADPIDFVLQRRRKSLWLTFDNYAEAMAIPVLRMNGCELLPGSRQQLCKLVVNSWLWAQVMDGVAALRNGLLRREDCFVQGLHRGFRSSRQQIASCLKLIHKTMKALQ